MEESWGSLSEEKRDKLYAAIAPATCVENISLDYNGTQCFEDLYEHQRKLLGVGSFGLVIPVVEKKTKMPLAIKVLNLQKYLLFENAENRRELLRRESMALKVEQSLSFLKNEVDIMRSLAHPNIIEFVRVPHPSS